MFSRFLQYYWFLVGTLVTIAGNFLIEYFQVGGETSASVSDLFSTMITPAGFTFSIRSVIYLLLIVAGVLVARKKITLPNKAVRIYLLSCIANVLRLVVRHYQLISLAVAIIIILLFSLARLIVYLKTQWLRHSFIRKVLLIYFGRVLVATLICITAYMTHSISGFWAYALNWSIWCIILAGWLNLIIMRRERTILTTAVLLRALYGISAANPHPAILTAISYSAIVLVLYAIYTMRKNLDSRLTAS